MKNFTQVKCRTEMMCIYPKRIRFSRFFDEWKAQNNSIYLDRNLL